jgi:hypothetical protein
MKVDFNTDADHIDVPLNKYGLSGYLLVMICIFLMGIWLVMSPATFAAKSGEVITIKGYRFTAAGIFDIGLMCIIVCVPVAGFMFYRIFLMKAGLTINMDGIVNNASTWSCGFINWNNITKINKEEGDYPMRIIVHVDSPEEFIKSQSNIFKRRRAADNELTYGSPAVINTYFLKCDCDELYSFLTDTLKTYKEDAK